MLSTMRIAFALSSLFLAGAAGDAPASLRGSSRDADDVVVGVANETFKAGVEEDMSEKEALDETDFESVASGSNYTSLDFADMMSLVKNLSAGGLPEGMDAAEDAAVEDILEPLLLMRGGWSQGGDKLWGSGRGMESINRGNVHYYDAGMSSARSHCGGGGCALITNPAGHRSINQFHIHFVHYHGWGASLKRRLEKKICGTHGWRSGGLPCHGKAAFYPGFPRVFSAAMSGGGMNHASVVAWPASCGGRGTIVQLAYGCSIEHQIRGDYNPRHR
jgi:hypothetical protein